MLHRTRALLFFAGPTSPGRLLLPHICTGRERRVEDLSARVGSLDRFHASGSLEMQMNMSRECATTPAKRAVPTVDELLIPACYATSARWKNGSVSRGENLR